MKEGLHRVVARHICPEEVLALLDGRQFSHQLL